jgi:hypothetical protein
MQAELQAGLEKKDPKKEESSHIAVHYSHDLLEFAGGVQNGASVEITRQNGKHCLKPGLTESDKKESQSQTTTAATKEAARETNKTGALAEPQSSSRR